MRKEVLLFALPAYCLCAIVYASSVISAAASPCDTPAGARQIAVRDFQATGDGKTDDGPALRAAIKSAIEGSKPAVIEFDDGKVYRITSAEENYSLQILGGQQIILKGNGAELSLLPPNRAFRIEDARDIAICGLTIDYSPLPFTQGTVASVDPQGGTFELAIEEGYDVPDVDDPSVESNRRTWRFAVPFGADRHDRRIELNAVYAGSAERRVRIKPLRPDDITRLRPNETRLVMTMPRMSQVGGFAFRVADSERIHFESMQIYSVPRMTFVITNNLGPVSFNKVDQRRRPGTTRLMTGWQDIFHATNNRGPITLENCYTDRIFDDTVNFSAIFQQVVEKLDNDRWRLRDLSASNRAPPMRVGDRIQAIDLTPERRIIGESKIVSVSQNGGETILSMSPPLTMTPTSACGSQQEQTKGGSVCGTRVMNLDAANENSVVRGCTIYGSVRLRSKTTVENNTIDGPLAISADPIRVGPLPNGTIIRNNYLSGAIRIGADNTERDKYNTRWDTGERWARNILLENNRIRSVFRTDGAEFSLNDNNLLWPPMRKFTLRNSGPVRVRNLKTDDQPIRVPLSRFKLDEQTSPRDIVIEDRRPN